jgi:hypothetical protein
MKIKPLVHGVWIACAAVCGLSRAASAQFDDAASAASALIKASRKNIERVSLDYGVAGPACALPYEGLTQKGKWAVTLDNLRFEKGMLESRVKALSILDFSYEASELRDALKQATAALRSGEDQVRGEVEKAGLTIDVDDLTIRKLVLDTDYRIENIACGSAIGPV